MTRKLNVALLYGGRSVEHEISIRSAKNVFQHIDKEKFNVILIGIDKKGVWYLTDQVDQVIDTTQEVALRLNAVSPMLINEKFKEQIAVDLAFPVLHGTDGEDGSIQGLFTAMDIPIVGSGVLGSSAAMDKIISKKLLSESNIPSAKYLDFTIEQKEGITYEQIERKLGVPFIIKSAALGSSVGVSKVSSEGDFLPALDESFKYDNRVIIEEFVEGRELECSVIGNKKQKASMPGEIVLVKEYDFYTYTAKYIDKDAIEIKLPAELNADVIDKIRQLAIEAFNALRCEDFARVDLFLTKKGEILVNEINTIPGFTSASMFPMMWQQMGMSYTELISELINMCLERDKEMKSQETDYNVVN